MKRQTPIYASLAAGFTLLMSLPWLVPHMGWTVLVGIIPLLVMERLYEGKHFWLWHYATFVLWNAVTTWWVGEATVGGAVFAVLANSLQMSVIFGGFRWVKRRLGGALPYFFLAAAWIAWERWYLTSAQISWPWLVLGNAFADTTSLVQWYSVLGTLGGSLWVWASNLSVFGLMIVLSDGRMASWNGKARFCTFAAPVLVLFGPMIWSACLKAPSHGEPLKVVIGQPNYDPYEKFQSLSREEQDRRYIDIIEKADWSDGEPVLVLAPETFTSRVYTNAIPSHETSIRFQGFLERHPQASIIFGASTLEPVHSYSKPHPCAYDLGKQADGKTNWIMSHNSAIITDSSALYQIYHKSKLVVGTELTPYPKLFIPLENLLGGNLMGKDIGQKEISCLSMGDTAIGVAVCYESVYGEFCTGYVRKGAKLLTVITNDAWWGNTPGYRQHLSYSRLRAIETHRYVARCANTGISAIIDPQGKILSRTEWWEPDVLEGKVLLSEEQTFFVRYGDIVGRISVFLFLLTLAAALFRPRRT